MKVLWFHVTRFRPLTGINFNSIIRKERRAFCGFRPLSGINFNPQTLAAQAGAGKCFRPLSGINFNSIELQAVKQENGFRPLSGINFNWGYIRFTEQDDSFRPLSGINFNKDTKRSKAFDLFPSPYGDKFQR